ncbi:MULTISPECIES: hypothetical protein [Pseudomonas]|uniref:Uncharacterized protein n=1 Tax=Pseudomonas juntendi TaxID=2666183 RepID=A0AAJ5S4L3_9PSED|nr:MULTISPECIES: hypothetical protein [Pseudomonas]MBF8805411.1 hypothetical protein [Pseudomonas asiatica]WEA21937.1 hypothetical protein PWA60_06980 [Pseudomonas juntendi]
MSHPKNTTAPSPAQPILTSEIGFFEAPIDNRGVQLLSVAAGTNAEDALRAARTLASGLSHISRHIHDSVNMGEFVYCDGMATLSFLGETVSALIWSVEKSVARAAAGGVSND